MLNDFLFLTYIVFLVFYIVKMTGNTDEMIELYIKTKTHVRESRFFRWIYPLMR